MSVPRASANGIWRGRTGKKKDQTDEEKRRAAEAELKRLERKKEGAEDDDEDEEDFDPEKLRQWELQKLRYYFAVAEFDSVATASAVSDQVDGIEFEYSSVQVRTLPWVQHHFRVGARH